MPYDPSRFIPVLRGGCPLCGKDLVSASAVKKLKRGGVKIRPIWLCSPCNYWRFKRGKPQKGMTEEKL